MEEEALPFSVSKRACLSVKATMPIPLFSVAQQVDDTDYLYPL